MKSFRSNRVWQILYPLLLYYVSYNLMYIVFSALLGQYVSSIFCLMLAAILTLPLIYKVYLGLPICKAPKMLESERLLRELLAILGIVILGIILNIIITHLPLMQWSVGYTKANQTLYSGSFLTKVCANAVFIPMLEELLYRGIICGQLSLWYQDKIAVVISAIFFGIMHLNVIQFLYAFLMGLALGTVYCKTKKLWVCIAAHGLTNLVVVLYTLLSA